MIEFSRVSLFGLLCAVVCGSSLSSISAHGQEVSAVDPDADSLQMQLQSKDIEEQIEAAVQLGRLGPYAQSAIDPLVGLLKTTENTTLRYECIVALGHIGPMAHESAGSLAGFLNSDSELIQSAAIESLRRIGTASPEAEAQIRSLCKNQNAFVAISAIRCLIMIAKTDDKLVLDSIPRLVTALADNRADIRNEASVTLAEIGPAAVPVVAAVLSGKDARSQVKACEILASLGSAASSTVPALLLHLNDKDELVVRAATKALGKIRAEPGTVLPALNALLQRKSVAVRVIAVRAIADYGPEASGSSAMILNLLADDTSMLRASAADALGQIQDSRVEVIDALVKALSDSNGAVTINAANALSMIGAPAVPALVKVLDHKDHQRMIVEVIGEIGPGAESAVPALVELLSSAGEDEELQREIFIALASIGARSDVATSVMLKIVQDPAAGIRRPGAAYVLARIGEKKALPVLKELLATTDDERLQRAAAWGLVTLDPQNAEYVNLAMPHLIRATSADLPLVRREAMTAFTKLGPLASAALPSMLEHAASDPDATVRMQSLHGLAEIHAPPQKALPVAIASLADADSTVRNAARFLLGSLGPDASDTAPLLRETLRNGEELDRILSAWALVHVAPTKENSQAATPLLLTALRHSNPRFRTEAAITLGSIGAGSNEVRAALEAAQNDEDPQAKKAIADALKAVKG